MNDKHITPSFQVKTRKITSNPVRRKLIVGIKDKLARLYKELYELEVRSYVNKKIK
tara:strand:- start:618 stop:785 length:168 start_codon:yes stop_codon:yes gene_type:complete